ncbi:unnamed protein product [Calypogeia fissa]
MCTGGREGKRALSSVTFCRVCCGLEKRGEGALFVLFDGCHRGAAFTELLADVSAAAFVQSFRLGAHYDKIQDT